MKSFYSVLIFLLLTVTLSGCGPGKEKEKVVARVNDYELFVSDFENEAALTMANKDVYSDPLKAKKALLDEIITKKVLLQEAQKENFDKEEAFMREIERYWEQALLKLLFVRKFNELSQNIQISQEEINQKYEKMKRKVLACIIISKDESSAKALSTSNDNFEEIKETLKEKIISGREPEWFTSEDLPNELEEYVFSLKPGQISPVITFGQNWAVIKVIEEKPLDVEPFESIENQIRVSLQRRKTEERLEKWIEEVRNKADIQINEDILKEIDLK